MLKDEQLNLFNDNAILPLIKKLTDVLVSEPKTIYGLHTLEQKILASYTDLELIPCS